MKSCCIVLMLIAAAIAASAQESPLEWSAKGSNKTTRPGDRFSVKVSAKISSGWHVYSITQPPGGPNKTEITLPSRQAFKLAGAIMGPAPHKAYDTNFEMNTETYEGSADFTLPLVVEARAVGTEQLLVEVRFQVCRETTCLPPKTIHLSTPVEIATNAAPARAVAKEQDGVSAQPISGTRISLNGGASVPEFSFTDFNGKPRKFSEFSGHVVLIDFWATWCKPCLADIPHLKELYTKYRDRGFEIIGMDSETLGQDEGDNDREFAKERDARARQIVATRGASWTHATAATAVPVAEKVFGVKTLPAKILIDAEGKIVAWVEEGAQLDQWLAKLLGSKP